MTTAAVSGSKIAAAKYARVLRAGWPHLHAER